MADIGIMIEGQDGLNWTRWARLLEAAEELGYKFVFRSDHYTNQVPPDKDSLELWVSLTYAATHTSRIEFGPMVAPVTFRQPVMTVRMAAAVDDLSGGRLTLGLGSGWQDREHRKFGVPFYDVATRLDMLEEALEITRLLLHSDTPVDFTGKHFSLDGAILLPRPQRPGGPPILIGGKGRTRTLPLVARYATEWNATFIDMEAYRELSAIVDRELEANGRQPSDLTRSLMAQVIFGKDEAALVAKLDGRDRDELVQRGMLVGTASMLVDQIGRYEEANIQRFMLQWLDQDDIEGLELIARDVLPHFHTS